MLKKKQPKSPASKPTKSKSTAKTKESELVRLKEQLVLAKRELEIEAALEKVRSRSLAMLKSVDLAKVVAVQYEQIASLHLADWGSNIVLYKDDTDACDLWLSTTDQNVFPECYSLPIKGHPILKKQWTIWKERRRGRSIRLSGKRKEGYDKYLFAKTTLGGLPKKVREGIKSTPEIYTSFANMKYGLISAFNLDGPLSVENFKILQRFAKVFEQAYSRFLDIQRAEAQARMAQIEVALERVRARTMAMNSSEDVNEAVVTLFGEIKKLGIEPMSCGLNILHGSGDMETWAAKGVGESTVGVSGKLNMREHPSVKKLFKDWKAKRTESIYKLKGKEVKDFYKIVYTQRDYSTPKVKLPDKLFINNFLIPEGSLWAFTYDEVGAEHADVLKRFARVFSLTYRRYKDLQKAEAQAREAQIEAALERVRGRSLAMHNSDELTDVGNMVFQQIKGLGIHAETSWLWFVDNKVNSIEIWTTHKNKLAEPVKVGPKDYHTFDLELKAWKRKEPFVKLSIPKGDAIKSLKTIFGIQLTRDPNELQFHLLQVRHDFGFLGLGKWKEATEEEISICSRFAKVFEQAYTRFLDLQKAEAQAREAQIEAALERIRAASMAMHNSNELIKVVRLMDRAIRELEVDINGIQIVTDFSDIKKGMNVWLAVEGVDYLKKFHNPYIDHPTHHKFRQALKDDQHFFTEKYSRIDKNRFLRFLYKHSDFKNISKERKEFTLNALWWVRSSAINKNSILAFQRYYDKEFTEKENEILKRFGKAFEQSYTRFLDLQKAEAQAREAQIEVALERVRAKTMGMHSSNELSEIVDLLYSELSQLHVELARVVLLTVNSETLGMHWWMASPEKEIKAHGFLVPPNDLPMTLSMADAWKEKRSVWSYKLTGKDKKKYDKFLFSKSELSQLPEEVQMGMASAKTIYISGYCNNFGLLTTSTLEPLSEKNTDLLSRFGKVFEQTYTRFLDLKKAEAQAREAQIEAALEKVRSRSMAMHKSDELLDVITVVSEQLQLLDFRFNHVSFANSNFEKDYKFWTAAKGMNPMRLSVPHIDIAMFNHLRDAQQQDLSFFTDLLTKQENRQWHKQLLKYSNNNLFTKEENEYIMSRGMARSIAIHPNIILILANYASVPYSEEENKIIARFGQVFEQSYTRFLDLQRAEAQAREAQIEAALERVRARAMAMQKSQELKDVVNVMLQNLQSLGIETLLCEIVLFEKNFQSWKSWLYLASEDNLIDFEFSGPYFDHPFNDHQKKAYQRGLKYTTYVLEGADKIHWDELFHEHMSGPNLSQLEAFVYPMTRTLFSLAYLNQGAILVAGDAPLSDEGAAILQRFAKVVDLTYTRVEDLQMAELRSVEAIRSASLDRVRAEIASMRTTKDLERITPLIWKELTILNIPFIRCGVFIMDEPQQQLHTFLSTPDGKAIAAFHLPYDAPGRTGEILGHWKNKQVYVNHWDEAAFSDLGDLLVQEGALPSKDAYLNTVPKGGIYLHCLPFRQGMLYVGNSIKLNDNDIHLIQSVAEAFSTAYSRYEDFNKLEAAKQQVEKTLTDLRAAQSQLVQSEKMASLGELTAGIAHEIQNPLNFVNNFSEVSTELVDEMKSEIDAGNNEEAKEIAADLKQNLQKINHHGKRAGDIVKGMLQHSRSSSGQKELTDINALADEYLRLAYHGLRAKDKSFNSTMKTDFDNSLEKVNVIPQDIGRVVLNLITNAFYAVTEKKKAQPEGYEPTVTVSTKQESAQVLISVSDNGNGIPDTIKEKIFQPFFTTKPTGQGTGLGLSLSYDIVKAHGGDIKIESKESEGSVFIIKLPIV